jgi:hypothetical protein
MGVLRWCEVPDDPVKATILDFILFSRLVDGLLRTGFGAGVDPG